MNALVMYDRQTGSLWSQILGRAVRGPLAGAELEPLPHMQSTWAAWRELHPDTVALRTSGAADPYERYYGAADAGVIGETRSDDRLPPKAMLTGAVVDGVAVAYPWQALPESGVVNDSVGDTPVVLVHDRASSASVVFDSRVQGLDLTFELASQADAVGMHKVLLDRETGSRWSAWGGVAFEGPLAGERLTPMPATTAFWFGWKDFYPDTLLYTAKSSLDFGPDLDLGRGPG